VSLQVAQEAVVAVTGGVQHPIRTAATVTEIMANQRTVKACDTILVIDDSFIIRVTIKAILEGPGCGYTVELAENGRDGLKAMQGKRFSLVLSDIRMPFKDGFEMTQLLREWEDKCRPSWHQPLILMSANIAGKELPRVEAVGANGFLQKPVNLADLAACIEHNIVVVDDPGAAGVHVAGAAEAESNTPTYTSSTQHVDHPGAGSDPFDTARIDSAAGGGASEEAVVPVGAAKSKEAASQQAPPPPSTVAASPPAPHRTTSTTRRPSGSGLAVAAAAVAASSRDDAEHGRLQARVNELEAEQKKQAKAAADAVLENDRVHRATVEQLQASLAEQTALAQARPAVVPVSQRDLLAPAVKLCLSPGGTSGERVRFPPVVNVQLFPHSYTSLLCRIMRGFSSNLKCV
jgi:CheY-like chemotaxis protein